MTDYIEWDGTETRLYELLMWWGTRIPWEHSPECDQDEKVLDCCFGVHQYQSHYGIEASTFETGYLGPIGPLTFVHPDGTKESVENGDRIYYRDYGKFELVKK